MADHDGLEAPITAVTVFTDGARVVRAGEVELEPGPRPVVIGHLPAAADPASVRVACRGAALVNVEVHRRFAADPLREEPARLREEFERCQAAVQALEDEDAAEQARLTFLAHLASASATALARAVGFGRAGHGDLARMSEYISADTASALGRRREITARKLAAQRELEAARHRLDAARKPMTGPAEYSEVSATLEASEAVRAGVEFSYHVYGASWRPLYDLALTGERLGISYLAEVSQTTGEDWPEVQLVLSTARHGVHDTLPELRPWYIGRPLPAPRPMMMRAMAAPMDVAAGAGAAEPQPPAPSGESQRSRFGQPQAIEAELMEGGEGTRAGLAYQVQRPLAVPADGDPHKTTVAAIEAGARLDHLVVPALAAEAYLRATVTNGSRLLLLPGPARVFHEAQYVGETALETVAPGEEFELQLGVDDQIRVERELRRRSASKAVIGGTRTIDIAYEITVENHRPSQARVSVHDHIPVSRDGDIKVRLRETSPDPSERDDLGELTWDLTLGAGQQAVIRYRFTVEHPASATVAGL